MNTILIFCIPLLFTMALTQAEQQAKVQEKILQALASGNARSLSGYFHTTVDLEITGSDGTYSKSQTEGILGDFFKKIQPSHAEYLHQGSSGSGSMYHIGRITSQEGNYRFYILLKTVSEQQLIHQVQIEKE